MDKYPDKFLEIVKIIIVVGLVAAVSLGIAIADERIYDRHEQYIGRVDDRGYIFDRHEGYRGRIEPCNR